MKGVRSTVFCVVLALGACGQSPEKPGAKLNDPQPAPPASLAPMPVKVALKTGADEEKAAQPKPLPSKVIPGVKSIADSPVSRDLNQHDIILARSAENQVLEKGGTSVWRNPDNGPSGEVTLMRSFKQGSKSCRDLNHLVYIGDRRELVKITACKDTGSGWTS
jgi:surface antigen